MSINTQESAATAFTQETYKDDSRISYKPTTNNNNNEKSQSLPNTPPSTTSPVAKSAPPSSPVGLSLTMSEKIVTSLLAGASSGGLAKTVIAPLDRSKIFFQTNETRNYRIKYAIRWLRHGYRTEGMLSLWRGNSATMARILPYAAIQFMSHEQYKVWLKVEQKDTPKLMRFVAGSMAGVTGQLLTYPLDKVRAIMAVTNRQGEYKSIGAVVLKIQREEGLLALYRGLTPTMLGVIVYAGTSFFTYGTLKETFASRTGDPDKGPSLFQRLLSGGIAGVLGQTASYPLDIIRRRMQTGVSLGKGNKYASAIGTFLHVLRHEGIRRGLYKGLSMNFIKGPIATGISFTTFDYVNMGLQWLCLNIKPR